MFTTDIINIQEFLTNNSSSNIILEDSDDQNEYVQFEFDFINAKENDIDASELTLSDCDLETMITQSIDGFIEGEQEYIHYDDNDKEYSLRLVWKMI